MKVALLNEKILFQKSAVVSDAIGNRKNAWEDYYSCFATIGGEGGNEKSEAGQTVDGASITFTVRYCSQLVDIVSTGFFQSLDFLPDIISFSLTAYLVITCHQHCRLL